MMLHQSNNNVFNISPEDFDDDISEMHASSATSELDFAMDESMRSNVSSSETDGDMVGKSVFIGWSMMPRLFEIWDFDDSGSIDREELLFGINEYCVRNSVTVPKNEIMRMMDEVDTNHDSQLDVHEFSVFLHKFVEYIECPLDDATYFLLEILDAQRSAGKLACGKKPNFMSLTNFMKNAFQNPLRKSSSSVSANGTTTSEGSSGEFEQTLLEDFRHDKRLKKMKKVMLLVNMKQDKTPKFNFNAGIPTETCDPTSAFPEKNKFSDLFSPNDVQKISFHRDELSDILNNNSGSVLDFL